ncbi:MAG: NAD-dependent epimerase/dehydratase family protein [Woeseiaceae bacterium]|jgi:2'-hydroxyisoflavone reductase
MAGNRRDFIKAGLIGAAAAGLPAVSAAQEADCRREQKQNLEILILGGTGFIGPHMVREALRRGHSVTLFNRGRTNNEIFPDLETIKGDRDKGLDGLKGRRWDAVIDNSGYVPRHVQDSARLLAPNCDRYLFISTVAVYADISSADDEDSALATIADESIEEVSGETYGPLKALCEKRAAAEVEGDRLTVLRPTYIAGPGDRTDRFSCWPIRTRRGGEMLWPGSPGDPIQIVDVRDLANFTVDCLDRDIPGTYNMVNPPRIYTMGRLLEDCEAVTTSEVDDVWVAEDFLVANGLNPGAQIPIWGGTARSFGLSTERALAAGMRHRPERETVRDLLAWWDTLPDERRAEPRAGLRAEKEAEVIAAWKAAGT